MRTDLSPPWMLVKVVLFALLAALAATFLLWQHPDWRTATCLVAFGWASCRIYYFLIHALQHWIDPTLRYTGLFDLLGHWYRQRTCWWSRWPTQRRWQDLDEM
jgi:hypothetical protein